MRKLNIDIGVEEFEVFPGRVLRFNPADINLFNRLLNAQERIVCIEQRMVEKAGQLGDASGEEVIRLLAEADREMKKILEDVFIGNDFEAIFAGVNMLSVCQNDERVITNFLAALQPVLEEGAKRAARMQANASAAAIKGNRASRRAAK